jgi:ferredoxin
MPGKSYPSARSGAKARILPLVDFCVRFEPSGKTVRVRAGTSLLDAARQAELPVAASCGADGVCARCGLEVLAGADSLPPETPRERDIKQRNRVDAKLRLSCRVRVEADLSVTAPYW